MTKRVLVTGASKGIGRATAILLAQNGFEVTLHYHKDQNGALETVRRIVQWFEENSPAVAPQMESLEATLTENLLQFNMANRAQCGDMLSKSIEQQGPYYGIVNNAGVCQDAVFPNMTDAQWDQVIHTNLDGFYNVIQPCIMPMIREKQGRIVTLASVSGLTGHQGQVNYSAAKAGIIGATKALAVELAKRNITVNCVAPGIIETEMTAEMNFNDYKKHIPARRMGQPEEVASLIHYLMSDAAGYITRQVISVNGGLI